MRKADYTSEEWALYLAKRRNAAKAKAKAKKTAPTIGQMTSSLLANPLSPNPNPGQDQDNTLEVEVELSDPPEIGTFRERMLSKAKQAVGFGQAGSGSGSGSAKKPAKKPAKKQDINFLTKSLPLVAGIAASYAGGFYHDPYKPCAPQRDEVVAILHPIIQIVERRIQVTGEMSEDSLALLATGMAIIGFSGRSYVTYADIKRSQQDQNTQKGSHVQEQAQTRSDQRDPEPEIVDILKGFGRSNNSDGSGTHQDAIPGPRSHSDGQLAGYDHELSAFDHAEERGRDVSADDPPDRAKQLAIVAHAFKRDAAYRTANGLL